MMKKIWVPVLCLLLAASGCCAEEFFAEEAPAEGTEVEVFSDFFEEEEPAETAVSAEEAEDRSVVSLPTDSVASTELWQTAPEITVCEAASKANQVKISWTQIDENGKNIKLPKYVAYYVYEFDSGTGASYQRAKTTKRSVTLKSQTAGEHTYFVRAEYNKKGMEFYGASSENCTAYVFYSTMWKTISGAEAVQECKNVEFGAEVPVVYFTTLEPAEEYYIKFSWKIPHWNFWFEDTRTLDGTLCSVQKDSRYTYSFRVECPNGFCMSNATSFKFSVTPIKDGKKGKTKTASLSRRYSVASDWKSAPVILSVAQEGPRAAVTWKHETGMAAEYYEIYDGSKKVHTYIPADDGETFTDYVWLSDMSGHGKAGTHKITVVPVKNGVKGSRSKAKSLKIPKAASAPVTGCLSNEGGYIQATFYNNNPNALYFNISLFAADGSTICQESVLLGDSDGETNGFTRYTWLRPFAVTSGVRSAVVETFTKTGARLASDVWTISADGTGLMQLSR